MEAGIDFLQDYLGQLMVYNVFDKPLVYQLINSKGNRDNEKISESILSTGSKNQSLQIREPEQIRINSIDLVQERLDGSRARKKLTNETLQQFLQSSRKRHLTSFLQERNSRKKRERSMSPSTQVEPVRGKIFHIGCDYRLKPKFAQQFKVSRQ